MCMFGSGNKSTPTPPKEYAAQRAPTRKDASSASQRMSDRIAARTQTQKTNQTAFTSVDQTGKKTLLGA